MLNDAYASSWRAVSRRTERNKTKQNGRNFFGIYRTLFQGMYISFSFFFCFSFLCITCHVRDDHVYSAYPSGNNISAALQIPLCRPYGLTEVDYRAGSRPWPNDRTPEIPGQTYLPVTLTAFPRYFNLLSLENRLRGNRIERILNRFLTW